MRTGFWCLSDKGLKNVQTTVVCWEFLKMMTFLSSSLSLNYGKIPQLKSEKFHSKGVLTKRGTIRGI